MNCEQLFAVLQKRIQVLLPVAFKLDSTVDDLKELDLTVELTTSVEPAQGVPQSGLRSIAVDLCPRKHQRLRAPPWDHTRHSVGL